MKNRVKYLLGCLLGASVVGALLWSNLPKGSVTDDAPQHSTFVENSSSKPFSAKQRALQDAFGQGAMTYRDYTTDWSSLKGLYRTTDNDLQRLSTSQVERSVLIDDESKDKNDRLAFGRKVSDVLQESHRTMGYLRLQDLPFEVRKAWDLHEEDCPGILTFKGGKVTRRLKQDASRSHIQDVLQSTETEP